MIPQSYAEAGVSILKGEHFVHQLQKQVLGLPQERVKAGIGGFCALYESTPGKYLAVTTDGIGTKLKLASQFKRFGGLGQDLVAMNVNDLICSGARPLFFLDYLAVHRLDQEVVGPFMEGLVAALAQCGIPLIGGETAEMPDIYPPGEWDVAGFCVGEVLAEKLIDGQKIQAGDALIALDSSGFHSNGMTLLRRLLGPEEHALAEALLEPTFIYAPVLLKLFERFPGVVRGLAHITGGGVRNISRMNSAFDYELHHLPTWEEMPWPIRAFRHRLQGIGPSELWQTFNMGLGLVMALPREQWEAVRDFLQAEKFACRFLGQVVAGQGRVRPIWEGKFLEISP